MLAKVVSVAKKAKKVKKYGTLLVKAVKGGRSQRGGIASVLKNDNMPFKMRKNCTLEYVQMISQVTGANTLAIENVFNLSNLAKPDFVNAIGTNGSHQPYGFDTLTLLYNYYMVNGVKMSVEFFDPTQSALIVGYKIQGTGVTGLALNVINEQPWNVSKQISTTGSRKIVYSKYIPNHLAIGVTKDQYKDDTNNYGANVSTAGGPTNAAYLRLWSCSSTSVATTVQIKVTLKYYCTFWNRNDLTQS